MNKEENSNEQYPVLPAVFYGIFKIQKKEILGFQPPTLYTPAIASIESNECDIIAAHNVAFKNEEEAKKKLSELPKPAMYVIMPVYMAV